MQEKGRYQLMYEVADILRYKVDESGTTLEIHIPKLNLQDAIEDKHIRQIGLWIEDGRHITSLQRKKAYATIADIAYYTGNTSEYEKEEMKFMYMQESGHKYFSLSDCSIDTARDYITFILDFALKHGIALTDTGLNRTDDIGKYLYSCLKYKRCCICGKKADLHHVQAIGRGYNRKHVDDRELLKMALCREHHTESHTIGQHEFSKKYHVYGILFDG